MVVGEAMASGLPCVVTDVGDAGWLVGDAGRVAPPRDAEALAAALGELLALGFAGRQDLGRLARERVAGHFSLARSVAAYQAVYDGIIRP